MKKIISLVIILSMLIAALAVSVFAASDVELSVSNTKGKPGDTVEIKVNLDKNPSLWCASFNILYDNRCFELLEVKNGTVFTDSEFMKSKMDNSGSYTYYANKNEIDKNTTNTGCIVTLSFKILDAAPNGDQDITLEFPQNGVGFFFDVTDINKVYSVAATNKGVITITDSNAGPLPETTAAPTTETAGKSNSGASSGAANKEPVTEIVTEYVTDSAGEVVTDTQGKPETVQVVKVIDDGEIDGTDSASTTYSAKDGSNSTATDANKNEVGTIIVIVCICAIIIAIIIIIALAVSKKKGAGADNEKDNSEAKNTDTDNINNTNDSTDTKDDNDTDNKE